MLQPWILRLIRNADAFAATRPTLLFRPLDFGLWSSYFAVTYIHRAHKAHVECREKALRTKTTNKVELRPPLARLGN